MYIAVVLCVCVCVCPRDVGPSLLNYLLSLDKACGIHFRENKFFTNFQHNSIWKKSCNGLKHSFYSKIFYDTSDFRALSTIDKIINHRLVTPYLNFNRYVSQYSTNSITGISSFSLYQWVIRWTLVVMIICGVFIPMHPIGLYCVINKWKYAVQHNTNKTRNTMWYDIKVLC
jgi:hypothetical protein